MTNAVEFVHPKRHFTVNRALKCDTVSRKVKFHIKTVGKDFKLNTTPSFQPATGRPFKDRLIETMRTAGFTRDA